jgi:hypothetical protein
MPDKAFGDSDHKICEKCGKSDRTILSNYLELSEQDIADAVAWARQP